MTSDVQDCAARGLVVDIAQEVPVSERASRTDSKGRELNLSWSLPWQEVHVQMPWLSCQRAPPAEAAVLKAAKAVWSKRAAAADSSSRDRHASTVSLAADAQQKQQQQQQQQHMGLNNSRRHGCVVAAAAATAAAGKESAVSSLIETPPPPPRAALAAEAMGASASTGVRGTAAAAVEYQEGPLMLFLDTSALLSMLGCAGNVTSNTCFTLKLLQALAGSGRFGRGKH